MFGRNVSAQVNLLATAPLPFKLMRPLLNSLVSFVGMLAPAEKKFGY